MAIWLPGDYDINYVLASDIRRLTTCGWRDIWATSTVSRTPSSSVMGSYAIAQTESPGSAGCNVHDAKFTFTLKK